MKKLISLILCFCIIFGICAQGAVAAEPFTVSGGNVGVAGNISEDEFADEIAEMISDYTRHSAPANENDEFSTARLIVKSAHSINVKNAVSVISGYDNLWILQYESPAEAKAAYNYFSGRPGIQFVESDKPIKALSTVGSDVSAASDDMKYISWGTTHIGIDDLNSELKRLNTPLETVYVAVVDTGVKADHPLLSGRVEPTRINTSGSGARNSSADDNGHGTNVAGVIADATLENVIIKPYKVLDTYGNGTLVSLAAGINCAVKDGVDVINVSVGFYEDSEVLKGAIDNASENDITVIAAAGNDNTDDPMYPSSYESVIRVAASNQQNVAANFSNYGNIDIAAPGVGIMTYNINNGYYIGSGTSLAAPLVSAVAAVILSVNNNASPEDVLEMIQSTAYKVFEPNADKYFGAGILSVPSVSDFTNTAKADAPVFSHETALYHNDFELTITCETPGSVIYYTTDESTPSKSNPAAKIYQEPILIDKTTKLTAVSYADGYNRSPISFFSAIVAPYASEDELTVDENGVITSYTGTETSLSIPETVNGITVKKLGDGVLKNRNLTELFLPSTLTAVGKESVAENPNLKSIYAFGLTSIDEKAFYNCVWMKNIYFDEITYIGEYAFYNTCSKAYEVRESTFALKLNNLSEIPEGAFMGSALSEAVIDVPVTLGKNAFAGCNGLVIIDFADLRSIDDGAFKGLKSLREVNIRKLESIPKGAFSTCETLEHIHLPDAKFVDSHAFENCASLELIELPKVEKIYSNAFSGCDSLYVISLESVTCFEESAYSATTAPPFPKNLYIFYAPKLEKSLTKMFGKCPNLLMAYLSGATELAPFTFNGCNKLFYIDIQSIKYIEQNALANCSAVAIDARSLISTKSLPNNSGIILSNEFVESEQNAENLTVYGTPDTYIERYCLYKGYTFSPIPVILNDIPDYITENSEMITVEAVGFDLEYQWYWNGKNSTEGGTPIDGATDKSYTFTDADTAPFYYCKITHKDTDRDVVIYTDIIIKDSTPADYTEYNEAVKAANAIDRNLYVNIGILDEALAVDVSGRYSCEQDFVDAQTKAIYDAIANLKHNGVQRLTLNINNDELAIFQNERITYKVTPSNATYQGIKWSCEQNKKVILLTKNGYVRCIGDGHAVIKGEVINPDGEVISATITIDCDLNFFEMLLAVIFRPLALLSYALSSQKL